MIESTIVEEWQASRSGEPVPPMLAGGLGWLGYACANKVIDIGLSLVYGHNLHVCCVHGYA